MITFINLKKSIYCMEERCSNCGSTNRKTIFSIIGDYGECGDCGASWSK